MAARALPLVLCALALVPAPASARISGTATFSRCGGDRADLTFALRGDSKVRGASLRVSAVLYPTFGMPRPAEKIDAGRAGGLTRTVSFGELPADNWAGVVRYRWTRGRRTVAFGTARTRSARLGGRRGRAVCTLPVGRPPRDTTPPGVAISPETADWLRAPAAVRFFAGDDLSGVSRVSWSLDGGPVRSGRTLTIPDEGVHTIVYSATDAAGNTSAARTATLRVDGGGPTAPVVTRPFSVTGDTTPLVAWDAASDSGSGVRSYVVAIHDASGALVRSRSVAADALSVSIDDALPAGTYSAEVFAVDGATPEPFVTGSGRRTFEVRTTPPAVVSSSPAAGTIVPLDSAGADVTLTFDRPMDPAAVNGQTVTLARVQGGSGPQASLSCDSPCVTATLRPAGALPEGVYELKATTGVRSEEGVPLGSQFSARFSVPFFETDVEGECPFDVEAPWTCGAHQSMTTTSLGSAGADRQSLSNPFLASTDERMLTIASGGETISVRVRRAFVKTTAASCEDTGEIRLDAGGAETFVEPVLTATAQASTVTNNIPVTSGSKNIVLEFQYALEAACSASDPPVTDGLYVDDVQLARRP